MHGKHRWSRIWFWLFYEPFDIEENNNSGSIYLEGGGEDKDT